MKNISAFFTISLILLCCSCTKSDKEIEADSINDGIERLGINKNADWLVILPGMGCKGCIQEGEAFMRDFITNPKITFVLTKIESLKILQQKIGVNIKDYSNVFIDRNDIFNLRTKNGIYPCIVQLIDGKTGDHQFQNPENGQAFDKLKMKINHI